MYVKTNFLFRSFTHFLIVLFVFLEYIQSPETYEKMLSITTIREMKIKMTMRNHFTLVRVANINKSTNNKCWRGCGEKGILVHWWWECRLVQPLWKTVWNLLIKLKMELPFGPAVPLLGLYPKNPAHYFFIELSLYNMLYSFDAFFI